MKYKSLAFLQKQQISTILKTKSPELGLGDFVFLG